MKGCNLDTLEKVKDFMPRIQLMFESDKGFLVGPQAIAPFAQAIGVLAREMHELKNRLDKLDASSQR